MKTKLRIVLVACLALFMSGCGSSPQDQLVGKWEAGEASVKITAEFAKDGTAKLTMMGQTMQGKYKVNGEDELEWTMNGTTTKAKMKLSSSELELTNGDGKTLKYKRV
jgi:uncharacterized protein (TIGR03066 family)